MGHRVAHRDEPHDRRRVVAADTVAEAGHRQDIGDRIDPVRVEPLSDAGICATAASNDATSFSTRQSATPLGVASTAPTVRLSPGNVA